MMPFRMLALWLGMAMLLPAQNRTNFAWWNSPVISDLQLSADQSTKIRHIVRSYRNRLLDARNEVQKSEGELQDLLNDENVNVSSAKPVIEQLALARANSSRVFTEMSVQLRAVLTHEQWRTLVRRWGEMERTRPRPSDTQTRP